MVRKRPARKDKRLDYFFLIVYVVLIYGTLGITPSFIKPMERHHASLFIVLSNVAVISCISLALFVFSGRLKGKGLAAYLGIAAILLIYAFLLIYCTPITVEKLHLIEYGFLTYLVLRIASGIRSADLRYLYIIAIVALVSIGDELLQKVIPGRVGDVRDMAMNVLAGILALALLVLLSDHPSKLRKEEKVR